MGHSLHRTAALVIVCTVALCGCKPQCKYGNRSGRAFFEFDQIDYYHYDISATNPEFICDSIFALKHPLLSGFLVFHEPETIAYAGLGERLTEAGYSKKEIPRLYYPEFDSIFREHCLNSISTCYSRDIYRDILVFSKFGKTSGVAKICFDVTGWQYRIVGTGRDVSTFGQAGDMDQLHSLLYGK